MNNCSTDTKQSFQKIHTNVIEVMCARAHKFGVYCNTLCVTTLPPQKKNFPSFEDLTEPYILFHANAFREV